MYFPEYYAQQTKRRTELRKAERYWQHAAHLENARGQRAPHRTYLYRFGRQLERWGRTMQERHGEPRPAM